MYTLFQESNYKTDNILDTTLKNRGIEDLEAYKSVDDTVLIHYSKIHNMDKAVDLFDKHNHKESHVVNVVDCDLDGQTSSASLLRYVKDNCEMNIIPVLHSGKQHGLSQEMMQLLTDMNNEEQIDLVILPDAGTSDIKEQAILEGLGIDVLILDHHESENYSEEFATVINIQFSPQYHNKQLSGVGVVYKFLQALDDKYNLNQADKALPLVAMGLIGDSMSVKNLETRRLIQKGFENADNILLQELADKFINGTEYLTPNAFSFKIAPKINATIRIGTQEQKMDLLLAMMGQDKLHERTWRGKLIIETTAQKAIREAVNSHKRQATMKQKFLNMAIEKVEEDELYKNRIIIVVLPEDSDCRKLSGILAADIGKMYKRPVLVIHLNSATNTYTGSARSDDKYILNTKDFLSSTKLFVHCSGHQSAFGVEIKKEACLKDINGKINKLLEDKELKSNVSVDFKLRKTDVTKKLIEEVHSYEKYWGKEVEPALFYIEGVKVAVNDIDSTKTGNMMKFYDGDIQFMKFPSDANILRHKDKVLTLNVVGSFGVSVYFGKTDHQVTINDYEIVSIEDGVKKKDFNLNNIWN